MSATEPAAKKSRYLLTDWNPNDESKWDSKLAWRTLWIAPKLTLLGFDLNKSQLYWLTALPGLAAGILRLIYMFLPPLIGTRKLVGITSLLCIIPMAGWFYVVQDNTTPYWVLLTLAFMCGIGGGSFSGYMPSTGYFFPKRLSGTALGLQGGIGNLGMSVIQLVGPILMGFSLFGMTWLAPQTQVKGDHVGESIWVYNAAAFFIPWCIVAAILAFIWLRDVPVKANIKQQLDIFSNPNTWYMTILYVMTFGLFSGFSAVFALLINNQFGGDSTLGLPVLGATFAFLGPLIGSIKQMPMIMPARQAGGAIGFTSAIASLGPFLVGVALSAVGTGGAWAFFLGCAIFCALCSVLCWVMYARKNAPFPG